MPFELSTLDIFYLVLLGIGVVYAVLSLLAGMDFDLPFDIPGLDAPGEIPLASISPISIAAFITAFGAIGIIATRGMGLPAMTSVGVALVGSLLIAAAAHAVFFFIFVAPQASSAVRQGDLIGIIAEVTAPIPATSVGEISYVAMGSRQTSQARSATGEAIPRGSAVVIESITGTVLNVRPKS
jgi:membrane protein implicated in regulation of membrane protease activity